MKLSAVFWLAAITHTSAALSLDDFQDACSSIGPQLSIPNATVYFSEYIPAGTNLSLPDNNATCGQNSQLVSTDTCRISLYIATSNRSGINMEAWMPLNWTGRFLSTGNGGLAGCIGYFDIAYAASLGFASVGANNGHNGTSGGAFYKNPEAVEDFAYRSVHTGVAVGKQITKVFYKEPHSKSYYLGCSTGGRQGFKSAQDFPQDFDGIVAGAPAFNFNNLISWSGNFFRITGNSSAATFVPMNLWPVIHQDVMTKCDELEGYADGVLEDPVLCKYSSKELICRSNSTENCLTPLQSKTVDKLLSPLYYPSGSLIYPRMQPGAETLASLAMFNGQPFPYTTDWFRYVIYNDPSWDPATLDFRDMATAQRVDPAGISTWSGDLSGVRDRGAKILHYHGLMDGLISSEISPLYYEHVKKTMRLGAAELDDFYRFFRISGLSHCSGGDGASVIGQGSRSVESLDPEQNVLMAIVKWVEEGIAPETIVGTRWVDGVETKGVDYRRAHCRYPRRNVYRGGDPKMEESWECILKD
ncbi:tannase and feruloyl esterase [Lojkania enalia]|uniref:Carboxylic ester hydrolase n=1 Tax=Lojkania enalia TaxID=147567 RepID=A0A9P4JZT5_9PLEO|nr:tannase and feruloyl esterase [Didymosphaeria enalia]